MLASDKVMPVIYVQAPESLGRAGESRNGLRKPFSQTGSSLFHHIAFNITQKSVRLLLESSMRQNYA